MEDSTETYHWIFVLIFSYLIGIIYHRLLEWIRSGGLYECIKKLINIKKWLNECIKKLINIKWLKKLINIKKWLNEKLRNCDLIFCIRTIFKRNYKYAIIRAYRYVYYKEKKISFETYDITESILGIDINEYYKTYYSIMDKPAYNTIMFLEAQEAFLRNITWIVVAYHLCYYCSLIKDTLFECIFILEPPSILSNNCLILLVGLLLFFFLILFARYQTQMKVYKAVWEAGKYL
ncbi:MAG: hypothetical protein J6R06_07090 [Bacteroidales bacterium]|nr:hypothetical protein [Bacteroidales bacterium]